MKRLLCRTGMILAIMLFIMPPLASYGEQIEHHGAMVEADGTAEDCLSCHDGSLAGAVSSCTVKCGASVSHSILVDYPPESNRERYASVAEVEARGVRIVDGKVTCISCHNLRNPSAGHLVAAPRELCQICHIEI